MIIWPKDAIASSAWCCMDLHSLSAQVKSSQVFKRGGLDLRDPLE